MFPALGLGQREYDVGGDERSQEHGLQRQLVDHLPSQQGTCKTVDATYRTNATYKTVNTTYKTVNSIYKTVNATCKTVNATSSAAIGTVSSASSSITCRENIM